MTECDCAISFAVDLGRPYDHRRFKSILNAARFPTFVGPTMIQRNAINGGLIFFKKDNLDIAGALVNPHLSILLTLAVHPFHQGHHLGTAIMNYLRPTWARVIESKVGWFKKQGYVSIGNPKQGRKLITQIMVRSELITLAGRLHHCIGDHCRCLEHHTDRADL